MMHRLALCVLLLLCGTRAHAQTAPTPATIPNAAQAAAQQATIEGMMRACQALADDFKALRAVVAQQEKALAAADTALKAEQTKSTEGSHVIDALREQIENLQKAIAAQDKTVAAYDKQVASLQDELAKVKKKLSQARKVAGGAIAVAALAVFAGRR